MPGSDCRCLGRRHEPLDHVEHVSADVRDPQSGVSEVFQLSSSLGAFGRIPVSEPRTPYPRSRDISHRAILVARRGPRGRCGRTRDTAGMADHNVLGGDLEPCGTDPLTGFYRDGCCTSGPEDLGSHTICAVVTAEFLEHQREIGNDLSTPMPRYGFPGSGPR
jgi:hypothetical protein